MATPDPVHDSPRRVLTPSASDGNRVRTPICSATYWSSEMELRNDPLPGCGAAVRKHASEAWLPSTPGCDTPLNTLRSRRWAASRSRYGDGL